MASLGRKDASKEVAGLILAVHSTAAEIAVDGAQDVIVVVIKGPAMEGGEGELNAVGITNAMAGGAIRNVLADATAHERRLDPQVGGHHLRELHGGDGMLYRRPRGDPLLAERIELQPRVADLTMWQGAEVIVKGMIGSVLQLHGEAMLEFLAAVGAKLATR